tara:strand:- start:202 stop:390 length:189 start_codon:yes stop_codon:yes gene_type:complete
MSYPDYIFEPESRQLRSSADNKYFVEPSDCSENKYQQFNSLEEARHFLNEQKMSGTLGVKIN